MRVDGFDLMPFGTLHAAGKAVELHPKALLGAGWDDDPYLDGSTGGDAFARGLAALEVRLHGTGAWRADAELGVETRRYAEVDERNWTGGEARAALMRRDEDSLLLLRTSSVDDQEPITAVPEQVERRRSDAEAIAAREGKRWRIEGRLGFDRLDYLEDAPTFGRDEKDHDRLRMGLSLLRLGADRSLLGIAVSGEDVRLDPTSTISDHRQLAIAARWRHAFSERSGAEVRLGGQLRRHDAGSPGGQDDRSLASPLAAAELLWRWEAQSHVFVGGEYGLADGAAEGSNASRQAMLVTRGMLRMADRLALMHYAHLVLRADTGALPGRDREKRSNAVLRIGPEYRLGRGIGIRGWLGLYDVESRTGTDTDRHEASVEVVVAF